MFSHSAGGGAAGLPLNLSVSPSRFWLPAAAWPQHV
jgi:hypothetical protein